MTGPPCRREDASTHALHQAIGLGKHLSPTRSNGFAAMVKTIKAYTERTLAQK